MESGCYNGAMDEQHSKLHPPRGAEGADYTRKHHLWPYKARDLLEVVATGQKVLTLADELDKVVAVETYPEPSGVVLYRADDLRPASMPRSAVFYDMSTLPSLK